MAPKTHFLLLSFLLIILSTTNFSMSHAARRLLANSPQKIQLPPLPFTPMFAFPPIPTIPALPNIPDIPTIPTIPKIPTVP
ncbi:hypothetical protein QJS10_CPA09g01126 [Acorus calamus]|uniref:Uncharacterized protein n=1 Tax=Acorus calamus TaxID=4465 RepID=A0AAV9E509_ACOCL|nr:hypothetical protein QJS10_CPA09g01126 [Acorus calamus]